MASRTKTTKKPVTEITALAESKAKTDRLASQVCLAPENIAAATVMAYTPGIPLAIAETAAVLREHCNVLATQDMRHAEDMLLNQAHALQAMFSDLARSAKKQSGLAQIQTLTVLALKAQSQCRATLQTLSDVKHPKHATFINQANIAGQQQVNNGVSTNEALGSRGEKPVQSNELLKDTRNDSEIIGMDTGAARTPGRTDPNLEAVGTLDGAKHR